MGFREYLVPYLVSNGVALAILTFAFVRPRAVRWIWAGIFVWAAAVNTLTAHQTPLAYLAYAALTPSAFYRHFIENWFSQHILLTVQTIAVGQLAIALLLANGGRARKYGVIGASIFLLAIAPLGVGSAFPFSLMAAASLLVMEWKISAATRTPVSAVAAFIPVPDVQDHHAIEIHAPSHLVFEVAKEADMRASPVVAAIFRVRGLIMRDRPRPRRARGLVAETLSLGWGVLSYVPRQTIVMGAAARPWARDVTFSAIEPGSFRTFSEPDLVKIVWSLEVEPRGEERALFRTETRAVATDLESRKKFMRYWRVFSPGIRLIRWFMLRSVKREAERRYRGTPQIKQAA
jgi:hypothetical protein